MRQLVSVVTESGIGVYLAEGDEPVTQLAQMINPGLDVESVIQIGLTLGDALVPPARKAKVISEPKPKALPKKSNGTINGKVGRPRRDGSPNTAWGFSQAAVYETLRERGPSLVVELVAAFGYDPNEKRATQAMNTALSTAYAQGVVTRESLDPYSAGNPSQYARTRYAAVVVEPEQSID